MKRVYCYKMRTAQELANKLHSLRVRFSQEYPNTLVITDEDYIRHRQVVDEYATNVQ
jgi:hypothetical protein